MPCVCAGLCGTSFRIDSRAVPSLAEARLPRRARAQLAAGLSKRGSQKSAAISARELASFVEGRPGKETRQTEKQWSSGQDHSAQSPHRVSERSDLAVRRSRMARLSA